MADRAPGDLSIVLAAAVGLLVGSMRPNLPVASGGIREAVGAPQRSAKQTLMAIVDRIGDDNTTLVAAGVAFYAFLAVFPAVAALVAVFGLVADPHMVFYQLNDLRGLLPQSALDLLLGVVRSVADKPPGQLGLTFAISTVVALWSARAGVTSLMSGLDIAYRNRHVRTFVVATIVGLGLTIGSVLVASALVVTIAGLPAIYAAAPAFFVKVSGPFIAWVRWPAVAVIMALSVAVLYRLAPSQPLPHQRVFSVGTITATFLWLVSSAAFSQYVSWSGSYDATYGSLAGAVVLMLWLWTSSLALLVGATIDSVLAERPS